jgi:membrane protein
MPIMTRAAPHEASADPDAGRETGVIADAVEATRPASSDPSVALRGRSRRVPRRARLVLLHVRYVLARFATHHGLSWSAAIAFWAILSLPPLLIALGSLGALLFGEEAVRTIVVEQVLALVPAQRELVEQAVPAGVTLGAVPAVASVAALLFAGSRVLSALVEAINVMWGDEPAAGFWRKQRLRVVMLFGIAILFAASVATEYLVGRMSDAPGLTSVASVVTRNALPTLLVFGGLVLAYRLLPGRPTRLRTVLVGAGTAALLLRAAQSGFALVFADAGRAAASYGSLAGVAILMSWALVASAVVLIGAEVVATLDRHHGTEPRR